MIVWAGLRFVTGKEESWLHALVACRCPCGKKDVLRVVDQRSGALGVARCLFVVFFRSIIKGPFHARVVRLRCLFMRG